MADQTKKRLTGLRRNQQFLYIGIFTLVAVVVWVGGSLFQSQKKTGISSELQKMAVPLNPNINSQVIDRLEAKITYSAEELDSFEIFRVNIEAENRANAGLQPVDTSEETGSLTEVLEEQPSPEPETEPESEPTEEPNPEQAEASPEPILP